MSVKKRIKKRKMVAKMVWRLDPQAAGPLFHQTIPSSNIQRDQTSSAITTLIEEIIEDALLRKITPREASESVAALFNQGHIKLTSLAPTREQLQAASVWTSTQPISMSMWEGIWRAMHMKA